MTMADEDFDGLSSDVRYEEKTTADGLSNNFVVSFRMTREKSLKRNCQRTHKPRRHYLGF